MSECRASCELQMVSETRIPGLASTTDAITGITSNGPTALTRRCPVPRPLADSRSSMVSSLMVNSRSVAVSRVRPTSLSSTRRPWRWKSSTPNARSRCRTCWVMVGWLRFRRSAARVKLPSMATA